MGKSITKSDRLKLLLGNGYFPAELPPPFNTRDLAKYRAALVKAWPAASDPKKSMPCHFSIPRIGFKRRKLALVNPISQFLLSKHIADN
ncbi:MAG: hypothetical protein ACJAXK_000868 [Yoonia sp.]